VAVRFASNTVTFGSQYCITHCHNVPVNEQGVTEECPAPAYQVQEIFEPQIGFRKPLAGNIAMLNGPSIFCMVKKGKLKVFKACLYDINKAIEA
jgi:hypothetical protein